MDLKQTEEKNRAVNSAPLPAAILTPVRPEQLPSQTISKAAATFLDPHRSGLEIKNVKASVRSSLPSATMPNNKILDSPIRQYEAFPTPGENSPLMTSSRPSPLQGIVLGQRIIVRAAELIHAKLREYARTEGVIVYVPIHPDTWFGVQLVDGKAIKIRKSAFDVVSGSHVDIPLLSLSGSASISSANSTTLAPAHFSSSSASSSSSSASSALGRSPNYFSINSLGHNTVSSQSSAVSSSIVSPRSSMISPRVRPAVPTMHRSPHKHATASTNSPSLPALAPPSSSYHLSTTPTSPSSPMIAPLPVVSSMFARQQASGTTQQSSNLYSIDRMDLTPSLHSAWIGHRVKTVNSANNTTSTNGPVLLPQHGVVRSCTSGKFTIDLDSGETITRRLGQFEVETNNSTVLNTLNPVISNQTQALGIAHVQALALLRAQQAHALQLAQSQAISQQQLLSSSLPQSLRSLPSTSTPLVPSSQSQPSFINGVHPAISAAMGSIGLNSLFPAANPTIFQFVANTIPNMNLHSDALFPFAAQNSQPILNGMAVPAPKLSKRKALQKAKAKNLVGKFVTIESGPYKGEIGFVIRGGNGYYTVQFTSEGGSRHKEGNTVMKRSTDLRLINVSGRATLAEAKQHHALHGSVPASVVRGRTSVSPNGGESDEEEDDDIESRDSFDSGNDLQDEDYVPDEAPLSSGLGLDEKLMQVQEEVYIGDDGVQRRRKTPLGGLLSSKHETWIGRKVFVKSGKYQNEAGTIMRSGHGFYCVIIDGRGEVMKRANELELYEVAMAMKAAGIPMLTTEDDSSLPMDELPASVPVSHPTLPTDKNSVRDAASILLDIMSEPTLVAPALASSAAVGTKRNFGLTGEVVSEDERATRRFKPTLSLNVYSGPMHGVVFEEAKSEEKEKQMMKDVRTSRNYFDFNDSMKAWPSFSPSSSISLSMLPASVAASLLPPNANNSQYSNTTLTV